MTDFSESKIYEIQQLGEDGSVLSKRSVEAASGDAAARQVAEVADGTQRIVICRDGAPVNEMGIDFWMKRVRRR